MLTRKAGKGTPVEGQLRLATYNNSATVELMKKPRLSAKVSDGKSIGDTKKAVILSALKQTLSKDEDEDYCPRIEVYTTGMCRLIELGGAWKPPTTVSKMQ